MKEQEQDQGSRIRTGEGPPGGSIHAENPTVYVRTLDKPLSAVVRNGVLAVEIGANTLAHSATYSDWANPWNDDRDDYFRTFAITDAVEFAKDVALAMQREAEDGSSPLTHFIDKAMSDAVDDGSMACCEDEHLIRFGQTAPCERWAQETERPSLRSDRVDRTPSAATPTGNAKESDFVRPAASLAAELHTIRGNVATLRASLITLRDTWKVRANHWPSPDFRSAADELDALIRDTPPENRNAPRESIP